MGTRIVQGVPTKVLVLDTHHLHSQPFLPPYAAAFPENEKVYLFEYVQDTKIFLDQTKARDYAQKSKNGKISTLVQDSSRVIAFPV